MFSSDLIKLLESQSKIMDIIHNPLGDSLSKGIFRHQSELQNIMNFQKSLISNYEPLIKSSSIDIYKNLNSSFLSEKLKSINDPFKSIGDSFKFINNPFKWIESFSNLHITLGFQSNLMQIEKMLYQHKYESDIDIESVPLTDEEEKSVSDILSGKEIDNNLSEHSKNKIFSYLLKLVFLINFISSLGGILSFFDIDVKNIFESSDPMTATEKLIQICSDLPDVPKRIVGIRTAHVKQHLNLRQYDNQKAPILAKIADGQLLCVLKTPKDHAQWIRVAFRADNGEVIKGYVFRRYTKVVEF